MLRGRPAQRRGPLRLRPGYVRRGRQLPAPGRRGLRAAVGPGRGDVGRPPGAARMTLWGGRFGDGPADDLLAFTVSLPFDRRLAMDDLAGSRAHVRGLGRSGILAKEEVAVLLTALDRVA